MIRHHALTVVIALSLLAASAAVAQDRRGALIVTVQDGRGKPLENAEILAWRIGTSKQLLPYPWSISKGRVDEKTGQSTGFRGIGGS